MAEIQTGFFTHELQLRRIDGLGDPLKALGASIDFEIFRPLLEQLLGARRGGPGRPPWDRLLMFRILVLQTVLGLSDEKLEFELIDSASAQRFVGLSPHDPVPDSRTIWLFRDTLTKARMAEGDDRDGVRLLFDLFHEQLASRGLLCREGRTVDAMIVEVPRQRNTPGDNKTIKRGGVPADWPGQPRKLAQKDVDARWARKNFVTYYGYKNSIVGGVTDGWVHDYRVCPAAGRGSEW